MANMKLNTQDALNEIKVLIVELKNLRKETSKINSTNADSFAKLKQTIADLNASAKKTKSAFDKLTKSIDANRNATRNNTTETKNNSNAKKSNSTWTNRNTENTKKNSTAIKQNSSATRSGTNATKKFTDSVKNNTAATDKNTKSIGKSKGAIVSFGSSLWEIIKAFGIITGIQLGLSLVKDLFEQIKTLDSLEYALKAVTKTAIDYSASFSFLTKISKDYGLELIATTERYGKFLAAAQQSGLTMKTTEDIFRSMSKASAVLGLKTDELRGVYLALEQMLSKGKITTEELRRQLGERLPGAMGIMASSMNVSIPKLDEMMKKGQVLSAEVLPNFAKAVELAYGIDSVQKVDTLVASQNRLATSWQLFIATLKGDSGFLKGFFDGLTFWVDKFNNALMDLPEKIDAMLPEAQSTARKVLEQYGDDKLISKYGQGYLNDLRKKAKEIKKLLETADGDRRKELELDFQKQNKIITDYLLEREEVIKERAKTSVDQVREEYLDKLSIFEKYSEKIKNMDNMTYEERVALSNEFFEETGFKIQRNINQQKEGLELLGEQLGISKGKWIEYRKAAYSTDTVTPITDPDGATISTKTLEELTDRRLEIQKKELELKNKYNSGALKDEEQYYASRRQLLEESFKNDEDIANKNFQIAERDAKEKRDKLFESLKADLEKQADGKLKITGDISAYEESIVREHNQSIELAQLEHDEAMYEARVKYLDSIDKLNEDALSADLKLAEKKYNDEIAKAKEIFNASQKTEADKLALDTTIAKETIKLNQELIDLKIKDLELMLKTKNLTEQQRSLIQAMISELKASRPTDFFENSVKGLETAQEKLTNFLDLLGQFGQAMFDIGNSIYERRIENINAEIDAEKKKYEELERLAWNDKEQQEELAYERDRKIEQLEKKRLKEEQRQARLKKKQSLFEIALNTAIWITEAGKKTGPLGIPLAAIIAAIGAAQAAAVLAAPIPQYKDGLDFAKEDHIAKINDGGKQEFIKRGNKILTTNVENAIVPIKRGDVVYKDYETMSTNLLLLNSISNGKQMSGANFEVLFSGIEKSVSSGLEKAKIVNNVNLVGFDADQRAYSRKMSKWS